MSTPGLNAIGSGLAHVRAGDPIRARDHNASADALRALLNLRAGPGVVITATPAGWTIAVDPTRTGANASGAVAVGTHLGRVVNIRRTDGLSDIEPGFPSAIAYDITLMGQHAGAATTGTPDAQGRGVIENLTPTLNRPHTAARGGDIVRLIPAVIGDPCRYVVTPVGDNEGTLLGQLEILTEEIEWGTCQSPG